MLRESGRRAIPDPHTIKKYYDAQIRFADSQIGRFLDAIAFDRRRDLLVVTADHGECLGDEGYKTMPRMHLHSYEPVVKVPLLIAGAGIENGREVFHITQSIDIAPTIMAFLENTDSGGEFAGNFSEFEEKSRSHWIGKDIVNNDLGDLSESPKIIHFVGDGAEKVVFEEAADSRYKLVHFSPYPTEKMLPENPSNTSVYPLGEIPFSEYKDGLAARLPNYMQAIAAGKTLKISVSSAFHGSAVPEAKELVFDYDASGSGYPIEDGMLESWALMECFHGKLNRWTARLYDDQENLLVDAKETEGMEFSYRLFPPLPLTRMYDLRKDIEEKHNLIDNPRYAAVEERLTDLLAGAPRPLIAAPEAPAEMEKEVREALEDLGYI